MCFFGPSAFFPFRPRVFSCALGSVARREPVGTPRASWALAEILGTCSGGSKCQVPSGRDSKHVEPSRCIQTQEQVKIMSDGSCDIWDLECHHCRQTVLGDGKVFPRHQHARHATTFSTIRWRIWSLLTHMTTRWLGLFTCGPQLYEYNYVQGK